MKNRKGKVYIVGAGPGDPELISVKGLNALKKADCVLYDFLSSPLLLKYVKKGTRKVCVGKADGLHLKEQSEINQLLYEYSLRYRHVVRLKSGDPFVFSRGIEEVLYLKKKKINFEIIPGITSAFAACESFGIPLTMRGKFSSLAVLTGRKSNGEPIDAPCTDTLIYLMAVANIKNVVRKILASGRDKLTPCAFIERGTTKRERIITGVLTNIVERAQKFSVSSPAVFIVGQVVKLGKKIYGDKF